ncbi:hypothetical protein A0J48_018955 [Sphaerospermopsis aphanizomenoides BCCUSP55]|nr:hypothetical protein [Sphaerospermopsis aphanizomenoides]MBK1989588.1 hypothetical protein [Sphaerospermopsis aphanizomenoides BCCUSP55]
MANATLCYQFWAGYVDNEISLFSSFFNKKYGLNEPRRREEHEGRKGRRG